MTRYPVSALLALILGLSSLGSAHAEQPLCARDALEQAKRLLEFHFGEDERIVIDPKVVAQAPLRNPANKAQSFQVLEVWGMIHKGKYRMHLIYYQLDQDCVLMGQEILEYASL